MTALPLPRGARTGIPVIRTDFSSPDGWQDLLQALETPVTLLGGALVPVPDSTDYWDRAVHYVTELDDEEFRGAQPEDVLAATAEGHDLAYDHVYLADAETFALNGFPLLGVDVSADEERVSPFRVPALHVAGIEVNVELGNMDFSEYHGFEWDDRDLLVGGPGTKIWEAFQQLDRYDS